MSFKLSGPAAALAIFLASTQMSWAAPASQVPPVEAFGKRPMISDVTLSPGGTHYAALQWIKGKEVVAIYSLYAKTPEDRVKILSIDASKKIEEKVESISWLSDDTLGVVFEWEGLHEGLVNNTPVSETRLVAVKSDLSKVRQIPRQILSAKPGQLQHRIIDYLDNEPDHILMALDREGKGWQLNVYRVNVHTGTIKNTIKGGRKVAHYMTDSQSQVRMRWSYTRQKASIDYRSPGSNVWKPLFEKPREEFWEYSPVAFLPEAGKILVGHTAQNGFDEILKFDLESKTVGAVVMARPDADVTKVFIDRYTGEVIGFRYKDDFSKRHYVDPQLAAIQNKINTLLPTTRNTITSYDRKRSKFVILTSGIKTPGTYYLYLRANNTVNKILDRNAIAIDPAALGTMQPLTYKARDGKDIPAYLTTPPGREGPFPMIVMPHGGPTSRDTLSYNYKVQFLASRGYAVLQPQFRGSSGFGLEHQVAGYSQWGLLMQDDVTDGPAP